MISEAAKIQLHFNCRCRRRYIGPLPSCWINGSHSNETVHMCSAARQQTAKVQGQTGPFKLDGPPNYRKLDGPKSFWGKRRERDGGCSGNHSMRMGDFPRILVKHGHTIEFNQIKPSSKGRYQLKICNSQSPIIAGFRHFHSERGPDLSNRLHCIDGATWFLSVGNLVTSASYYLLSYHSC